ncbi:Uncharacterized protein APZ42_018445 [Daphnia magna]|uniref:Uncharacterized protein n=2 Tax=Daphnia magna TaxID=35525 RepID=A0ABQ9YVV9_9CRUS|nr:hypothetical protein OUZ56_006326 [Daphnia magna]KZS15902.1 Uncharacterized protein APZ42_018445 [Daphnia magna]
MELPAFQEKCICQICTCGRHRCRKHPQQATLDLGPVTRSAELLMNSSLAQNDYALPAKATERPVIKKLVDNLQVGGPGVTMEAKPSLRTDYPEFQVKRPVIHRLVDQLKTSGGAASDGEFAATTLSRDQYRPFSNVKRPEGGRKLRSSLKVRGNLDAVSTSHDYQDHENYVRPANHRIPDSIQIESGNVIDSSVSNADFRQFSVERPTIRRLQSSLKIPAGSMEQNQSLSQATYKEMPVSRPKRHLLADQITTGGNGQEMAKAGHLHEDYRQFTAERPVIKKLQDNLAIPHLAKFEAHNVDYPEHVDYAKPIRKKMEDTLKFSGSMEQASQSRKDYVEFHAERPVIKKLQDNIPVHPTNGYTDGQQQSTQRDYGQMEAKRPIINKLHDNLKMEGDVDLQTAYMQSYVQKADPVRPEIKRMHSTLAVAAGDFATESVVKADYPEHRVQRPTIAKPVGQLQSNDSSWGSNGASRPAAGVRRTSQHTDAPAGMNYFQAGPNMNRVRQMESSIQFGSGNSPAMMSEAQDSFIPLDGALKSQMMRPRTSNRLQDWNVGEPTARGRSRMNAANNNRQQSPPMTRDQVVAQQARRKHQATESSLSFNQGGQSAVETDGSLYKKSFTLPAIEPCPAAVLHVDDKSNYQFTRELHNHRFYRPIINSMG